MCVGGSGGGGGGRGRARDTGDASNHSKKMRQIK